MSIGAQVVAGFEWVEMVYNISGGNSGSSQCNIGCSVDNVKNTGTPETAYNNAAGKIYSAPMIPAAVFVLAYMWFG